MSTLILSNATLPDCTAYYSDLNMSDVVEPWDEIVLDDVPLPDTQAMLEYFDQEGMLPYPLGKRTFCKHQNCAKLTLVDQELCPLHLLDKTTLKDYDPEPKNNGKRKASSMRAKPLCSVDDCLEPARHRGFCEKHFPICEAEGCENLQQAKGLCIRHYKTQYYLCTSEEGCNNHIVKDGLCHTHLKPKKRQCKQAGCTKWSATGGFCIAHGGRASKFDCKEEGCDKRGKTGGFCIRHGGTQTMCKIEECGNKAVKGGICVKHGAITGRCTIDTCDKQSKTNGLCLKHGGRLPKCSKAGCESAAQKDGLCKRHHPTRYKCVNCQLFRVDKIGTVCSTCSKGRRGSSFELQVRDKLKEWFPELDFVHNKEIEASCLRYRPDFFLETDQGFTLIVEIDEKEHEHYEAECEVTRMFNIQQALGMPVVFIRFNCDAYKPDGINTYIIPKLTKLEQLRIQIWSFLTIPPIFEPGEPYIKYVRYSEPRIKELNKILADKMSLIK